jgi:putative DNA primase/helicase
VRKTTDAARGKWRGILLTLGMDEKFLRGPRVHGPCPMCGGDDRYRWDNKGGTGSFICNQCGAGDGIELVKRFKGWDFRTAAAEVDKIVKNVRPEPVPQSGIDEETRVQLLRDLYGKSKPLTATDPAGRYLLARIPSVRVDALTDLRFSPVAPVPGGGTMPALLAIVRDGANEGVTIHRTFLDGQGGKADMPNPRALMPGPIVSGSAVRLGEAGEVLGIAEGIETALAATARFRVPCWSAINSTMLAKWQPPEGVRKVIVFGDCDTKFGGQAAAYTLAHKLARTHEVEVRIPGQPGTDWADAA